MTEFVIVPLAKLSRTAQIELVNEFITRDSSVWDGSLEEKRKEVLRALQTKKAVITYDIKSETTDIRLAEDLQMLPKNHD